MRFAAAVALAAVPALVASADIAVAVGPNGTLTYDPATITASVGDTVTFTFHQKNHTVTQSSFAEPCTKLNATTIVSGFNPVAPDAVTLPTYTITVNDTNPIWFYCGQKIPVVHCAQGMVGVINAPAGKTIDQFKAAAMATGNSTATGGNSTTTNGTTPSGSGSAPASTAKSGAMRLSGSATAGLLTALGLMAGLTL